jgi:hypothetical protein
MRGYLRVFGRRKLKRANLTLQTVWESQTGEDDFGLSSFKKREKSTRAHLLRKRGTLFHPALFHKQWMHKRLKLRNFTGKGR